jgi:hypothetical protein
MPISFFSILSHAQYWARNTDHSAPNYVTFSIPQRLHTVKNIYVYIYIRTYIHIPDCVQTVYELPLLPNNTAVKYFYTNSGGEMFNGYLPLGPQPGGDWANT